MSNEIWKDIKGYQGVYQVSNLGRVRSLDKTCTYTKHYKDKTVLATHHFKGRVLSTGKSFGYVSVVLSKNGKTKTFLVHRLVADAFIDNPENKPQVNHIDGNPQNNSESNLEWVTENENQQHAMRIGIHSRCESKYKTAVICLDTGDTFASMREAERWLNCPEGKVSSAIISNQRVRGYKFEKVSNT